MSTVTVSSKYQVVIPKDIRDTFGIKAGTILEVISYGNRIEFVPIQAMENLKGIFKGMDTDIEREEDRL